jgi:hypothetical protein
MNRYGNEDMRGYRTMARLKSGTELEALRHQQIELAKKIREAEAKARAKEKADTERREILAGRVVLQHIAANPHDDIALAVVAMLNAAIVRPAERELFAAVLATTDKSKITDQAPASEPAAA